MKDLLYFMNRILFHQLQFKPSMEGAGLWCYSAVYYSHFDLFGDWYWIGLYKSVFEPWDNVTYWLDGNNSTYRNWVDGGPTTEYRCVVIIINGKFIDLPCSWTYLYICKGRPIYFCL